MAAQSTASPFYGPIRNNDLAGLRRLVQKSGANTGDDRHTTPLMYAAALGSLDAVKLLVEAGAKVNTANDFGATPLMWCAGDLAKVRYLLSKGASVTARSKVGRTPLSIAAAYDGSVEIARLMIEKGADVKAVDESGASVLAIAASVNNLEVARLLVAKGADVNTTDELGYTPLGNAVSAGNRSAELTGLLLDHGAKVNVASGDTVEIVKNGKIRIGWMTPLLLAVPQAEYPVVEMLVKAGAKVNAKDIRGLTPLALAVATDHADARIVRYLLENGADPKIVSEDGETVLDWARKYRNPEVMRALGMAPEKLPAEPEFPAAARGVPAAIEAGVAMTQRAGAKFLETGGCLSCHAQHMTGLAVAAARASGIKVDTAYGLARPPLEDGGFQHTAKGIRALQLYLIPGRQAEFEERIARAAAWLEKNTPVTTEDRTMQLLGTRWANRQAPPDRVQELIALQRADGGWGQTNDLPSDAYATGEALYALHETGMTATDAIYRRGVEYLLSTQQPDGSWHVKTRAAGFQPYFESGFPHHHDQWISQSGTVWAVVALSYAVPNPEPTAGLR